MTLNRIILPLMSLVLLTACIDGHESGASEAAREIGQLVLANGNLVVFVDEDPSEAVEIAIMEFAATPTPGAIEQMKAARATPAELWLSASDKELPRALVDAHSDERLEAPRAFAWPEHLLETADEGEFRAASYGGGWGDYDGYCDNDFADDWDLWAGATADASSSGTVGGGATVNLFVYDVTDVWVGVCNNTPWDTDFTQSELALYRDITGTPTWSSLNCTLANPWTFCSYINPQVGKGMHYWSSTVYDFKAAAEWTSGIVHTAKLRVRSE